MDDSQRINAAVAAKHFAEEERRNERSCRQNQVRQVRAGEQKGRSQERALSAQSRFQAHVKE